MVAALIQGVLAGAPEQLVSKNGRSYTTATIRVEGKDGEQFWRAYAINSYARARRRRAVLRPI